MSLSGRANVTFALKMSHFATVPMLLYRGKVTAEHLVDDCETTLNHHRNKSKVTYHTNTHTQITDKNVTFTRTACACGTRGVYKIKCVICICIAFYCILSLCHLKAFSYSMQRYNIFKPNPNISRKKWCINTPNCKCLKRQIHFLVIIVFR